MGYMHLFLEPSQVLLHDLTGAHHSIQEPEVKIIEYINANAVASTEISNNKIKNGWMDVLVSQNATNLTKNMVYHAKWTF